MNVSGDGAKKFTGRTVDGLGQMATSGDVFDFWEPILGTDEWRVNAAEIGSCIRLNSWQHYP